MLLPFPDVDVTVPMAVRQRNHQVGRLDDLNPNPRYIPHHTNRHWPNIDHMEKRPDTEQNPGCKEKSEKNGMNKTDILDSVI